MKRWKFSLSVIFVLYLFPKTQKLLVILIGQKIAEPNQIVLCGFLPYNKFHRNQKKINVFWKICKLKKNKTVWSTMRPQATFSFFKIFYYLYFFTLLLFLLVPPSSSSLLPNRPSFSLVHHYLIHLESVKVHFHRFWRKQYRPTDQRTNKPCGRI